VLEHRIEHRKSNVPEFHNILLQFLKHKSKRLQTTQAQLQEVSYAQAQTQETSYAQAQLQETSKQTQLQRKMFEVEHLIYN